MFIVCSNCDFKYLINSADLKPNGRMVECANCGHQWFQDIDTVESTSSLSPKINKNIENENLKNSENNNENKNIQIKNLPSTLVKQEKPSAINSSIVVILLALIFFGIWISKLYGLNTFVLINFYIEEFFFNLNLIVEDLSKIIHNVLN